MKRTLLLFAMLCGVLSLVFISCKKKAADETVLYTHTIVPLTALGFSSVPSAVLNQSFIRQLPAMGGKPPYTWSVESGSLPPGLTLYPEGRITGTPTATGEFTYKLKLSDAKGTTVTNTYTQHISQSGTVGFYLAQPQIPEFGQDQDVGYVFFVQGGTLPWLFNIQGLPNGINYNPGSGLIYGRAPAASAGPVTIALTDGMGQPASGSPVTVNFTVNAPKPVGGGGGGGGGVGCPSVYDGTYIGQFTYVYYVKGQNGEYSPVTAGFQLTIKLKCLATSAGSTVLNITYASCSDANFGCQVGGCTPVTPSIAMLPAEPPTTPSNPSQTGQGIQIFFPNGGHIGTANAAGNLNVTSSGRILSNSLDPGIQKHTWVASGGNFPTQSVPPGGPVTEFQSWNLTWSNTDK